MVVEKNNISEKSNLLGCKTLHPKEGYKQTELGLIPNDWEVGKLKDLINIKHGYAFEGESFSKFPSENILLTPGNFHINGKLYFGSNTTYFTGSIPNNYIFNNGDLAIVMTDMTSSMNILGNTVIIKSDKIVLHNQRIGKIIINEKNKLENKFLCLSLNSNLCKNVIKSSASGTTVRHTSPDKILKCKILIPKIEEQKKIASILSTWDNTIEKTEKLIETKTKLKKALMQQLLTGKNRFNEFIKSNDYKETELGFIPVDWEVKKLEEVLKICHGKSQHNVISKNGLYPILGTGGEIGRTNSFLYNKPSVLIGRKGTIDSPQYVESPFWTIDTLFYSDIFENTFPKFIYYYFKLINWYKYNEASAVPSLSAKTIHNIRISIPPLPEQKKIASVLNSCDKEIELLAKKLETLKNQKKGLMQKLLTGQIRVKIDI